MIISLVLPFSTDRLAIGWWLRFMRLLPICPPSRRLLVPTAVLAAYHRVSPVLSQSQSHPLSEARPYSEVFSGRAVQTPSSHWPNQYDKTSFPIYLVIATCGAHTIHIVQPPPPGSAPARPRKASNGRERWGRTGQTSSGNIGTIPPGRKAMGLTRFLRWPHCETDVALHFHLLFSLNRWIPTLPASSLLSSCRGKPQDCRFVGMSGNAPERGTSSFPIRLEDSHENAMSHGVASFADSHAGIRMHDVFTFTSALPFFFFFF